MTSRLQFTPATAIAMHEHKAWYVPTWEKVFRLTNITLLVAGIAASFFLKIPLLTVGVATYGIFYFLYLLRGRAKNGSASDDDGQSLQAGGVVEKKKYEKALNIIEGQKQTITVLRSEKATLEREVRDLRRSLRR